MKNSNQVFVNLDILVSESNHISVIGCDYVDCYGNEQPIRIRKVDSIWDTFNEGCTSCVSQTPVNIIFYLADKSKDIVIGVPVVIECDIEPQLQEELNEIYYLLFDFKSSFLVCYKRSKNKMVIAKIDNLSIDRMIKNAELLAVPSEVNHYRLVAKENLKQFIYRYVVNFKERKDEANEEMNNLEDIRNKKTEQSFEYIEETLFDGTFNTMHDGGLLKYHKSGKPKKLALKWYINKNAYFAYFWFEDEEICAIFNKFYGQHPDTKTDFIIHIDPIKKKYELSLYRYGLKEPVIIPESAYQLIVFKSGFENYRSDNYNQPTGAWIW